MSENKSKGGHGMKPRGVPGLMAKVGPQRYKSVTDFIKKKKETATVNKYKELKAQEEAKERKKQKKRERRKRKRISSASSAESEDENGREEKNSGLSSEAEQPQEDVPVYRGKEAIGLDDVYDQMMAQVKKDKREKGRGNQAKRQKLNDEDTKTSAEADLDRIRRRAMMTSGGDEDDSMDENSGDEAIRDGDNVIGAGSDGASGRRQRSSRPHMEAEDAKQKKSDPFFKEKQEFQAKMTEKERKDKEIQERLAMKKAQKEKRDNSKKNLLYRKTKSGQPLMKGMMSHLLGKIEQSVKQDGK